MNELNVSACIQDVSFLNLGCNTTVLKGHAIAQAISEQFVTVKAWIQYRAVHVLIIVHKVTV
jgi:hypothetical protein